MNEFTITAGSTGTILARAQADQALVRVSRKRLQPGAAAIGYVMDMTAELVLLHKVSDRVDLDGYEIMRVRDTDRVETDFERVRFFRRALELKGEMPRYPKGVQIDTLVHAIETIAAHHGLLVISRERKFRDEVAIGRLAAVLKTGFRIDWMSVDAKFAKDDTLYRYADITRLEFGGEYERTLALVAGFEPGTAA